MARKKLTPYQRIVRASQRGTGIYLTPDECAQMATDTAILTVAQRDDMDDQGYSHGEQSRDEDITV